MQTIDCAIALGPIETFHDASNISEGDRFGLGGRQAELARKRKPGMFGIDQAAVHGMVGLEEMGRGIAVHRPRPPVFRLHHEELVLHAGQGEFADVHACREGVRRWQPQRRVRSATLMSRGPNPLREQTLRLGRRSRTHQPHRDRVVQAARGEVEHTNSLDTAAYLEDSLHEGESVRSTDLSLSSSTSGCVGCPALDVASCCARNGSPADASASPCPRAEPHARSITSACRRIGASARSQSRGNG